MGDFSMELCGGTHATATGDIGLFKITSESAVAAGLRRIEGVTGHGALTYVKERDEELSAIGEALKAPVGQLPERVQKQIEKIKELEKENKKLKEKLFSGGGASSDIATTKVCGATVLAQRLDGADAEAMRNFVDDQKNRLKSAIIAIGAAEGEKAILAVGVTDDLSKKFPAGKIVKEMAAIVGGGGGGRPDFAQAGGKKPEKLDDAISAVASIIEKLNNK